MDLDQLASEISSARETSSLLPPPSHDLPGFSIEDGYVVARRLHEQRVASGARPVGMKLGFTNQSLWEALGLTSPFWSPIYDDSVTSARQVPLGRFVAPRIEPEIVLGTQAELARDASKDEICAAVGWVAPGFEIVQCHYPGWIMAPADAIADAGLHGALVVGDRLSGPTDSETLASTQVVLKRNGVTVARGMGADALGGPIDAVAWLLRLPGVDGLPAGSIVTTGTLTAARPVVPGETWQSESSGAGLQVDLDVAFP
jgi:2-keto-4-pentenoate hydratase